MMTRRAGDGRLPIARWLATLIVGSLLGMPAAHGDELADLRANQELLQHRIDQLAQAPPQRLRGGPQLAPAHIFKKPGNLAHG